MAFTTLTFIIFMAVVFTLYYIIPGDRQWKLLLVASWIFYAWASPIYLLFLLFIVTVTYLAAISIRKNYAVLEKAIKSGGV